jgi:hypothetical protein
MSTREAGLTAPAVPNRREFVAALATALLSAQLLLAPATLACTVLLAAATRLTRWRPAWLAVPAGAGLVLVVATGVRPALAGFGAWPAHLAGYLTGASRHHAALLAAATADLPRQLPVAVLAGSAQAAALALLRRGGGPAAARRPGLIAAIRGRRVTAALRAGRTATAHGCTLGVAVGTGRPAGLTWAEAERGVIAWGPDLAAAAGVCLPAACAALRRRKSVVIADLSGAGLAVAAHGLARSLGVPVAGLDAGRPEQLRLALGQVVRDRAAVITGSAAVVAGLAGVLTGVRDLRLRADALAWIHGCERADAAALRELIALGAGTGCAVLLSTASAQTASDLVSAASVVLAAAPVGVEPAGRLAALGPGHDPVFTARALAGQPAGTFAVIAPGRLVSGLRAVPIGPAARTRRARPR